MADDARDEVDMPSTLERSDEKAQRTYAKTVVSAEETYDGDDEAAHRAAWSAVKHTHEKVGDHWEPKDEPGPSDERAADPDARSDPDDTETAGGVDVRGSTKEELYERAKDLDVQGRSKMDKQELGQAIARKQG